jgi:hypothetical protein
VPIIDALLEVMKRDTVGDKTATHRLQAMQMKMHYPSRATENENYAFTEMDARIGALLSLTIWR